MAPWRYAAYDNENPDIVYMASSSYNGYMKLMCSTDGGETWNRPYMEPIKTTPTEYVFDMKQYVDKLFIYSQSDVYKISKAELIEQTTPVLHITAATKDSSIFDLSGRKRSNSKFKIQNSKLPRGIYIENGQKKAATK